MAVRKTKTGYQVQWYDADGRFRKQTFRGITREEAVREERKLLAARDRGEPMIDRRLAPTFATFAAGWVEEHRAGWKDSTREQYAHAIARWLTPAFGDVRVSDLTESQVRQLVAQLQDANLSPRRVNYVVLVLRMIVRAALRRRLLREDPLAGIRPLREPRAAVDPLSPEEIAAFLAACPPYWRPYFTVAFWTGARPGELFALKAGSIDWTRGIFRISAGRYRGAEGTPKTASSVRDVDMLPPVREALRTQLAQQAARRLAAGQGTPPPEQGYVFTTPSGRCLDINPLRERVWFPTLKRAGLRRRTMYQTRHSFASNALEAGEPPSWVAAMLGHATPEMLFQVYARFIPNRTRRDGAALLARMGRDTGHDATREEAPESGRRTPDLLPHDDRPAQEPLRLKGFRRGRCERGDLNPHGCLAHRILNPARLPVPPLSRAGGHSGKSLSAQGFRRGAVDGVSGRMVCRAPLCRAPYRAWATEGSDRGRRRASPLREVHLLPLQGVGLHVVASDVVPLEDGAIGVPRHGHGDHLGDARTDEVGHG